MHIGIDLDNTILDATAAHLTYYNLASGRSFTAADVHDFYIYRLYGWNKEERYAIYTQYGYDIHWNSLPFPGAIEALQQLYAEHQISIVTARPARFRGVTVAWLKQHNIPYHNILLTENKLQACTDLQVDVLIDDGPHYAEQFALAHKPVIMYIQPYNLHVQHEWVYPANNWHEVKLHLDRLKTLPLPSV